MGRGLRALSSPLRGHRLQHCDAGAASLSEASAALSEEGWTGVLGPSQPRVWPSKPGQGSHLGPQAVVVLSEQQQEQPTFGPGGPMGPLSPEKRKKRSPQREEPSWDEQERAESVSEVRAPPPS